MRIPSLLKEKFWQTVAWTRYASDLLGYYSRRNGYKVKLTPTAKTAWVCLRLKLVHANPELPRLPAELERRQRRRLNDVDHTLTLITGFLAHEAAHIRFTSDFPAGLLGDCVNQLEDERIERLQLADYDVQREFDYLGDYFLLEGECKGYRFTPLEGVLLWRWQHDFPETVWHCDDERWADVRPLVEAAWLAENTDQVTAIARWIFKLLDLPEDAPADPTCAPGPSAFPNTGNAAGPGAEGVPGRKPQAPAEELQADLDTAFALAEEAEGYGRTLARALQEPRPASKTFHKSRGRLELKQVINARSRPFSLTLERTLPPRRLFVIQDVSSSMGRVDNPHDAHYHAVRAVLALERAAQITSTPLCVTTFDSQADLVRPFAMSSAEARTVLGTLTSGGFTHLASALELVTPLLNADTHDLVVVLCDGGLDIEDAATCRRLLKGARASFLPVLLGPAGESPTATATFERVFGTFVSAADVSSLPDHFRRFLNRHRPRD